VGLFLAYRMSRQNRVMSSPFFKNWKWLFFVYGTGFFLGGLGHLMYNYWGVTGKYLPLCAGLPIPLMIEHAMISLLPKQLLFLALSKIKLVLAFIALTIVWQTVDVEKDLTLLLVVPSVNSLIGMVLCLGVIAWKYAKTTSRLFYLFPISILILIPAAIFQAKKISLHPWFDRNDFSHSLIILTLVLYYCAVQGYRKALKESPTL